MVNANSTTGRGGLNGSRIMDIVMVPGTSSAWALCNSGGTGQPLTGVRDNFARMTEVADFALISPVSPQDVKLARAESANPVYVRLNDDYVGYVLSTQNVKGAVSYIEDLVVSGASGVVFEYDVVHTPLWSELEPPSSAASWLLQQLNGEVLAVGNISWRSDSNIRVNNSFDLSEQISRRWASSPGAVIVGENYTAAQAATIASI